MTSKILTVHFSRYQTKTQCIYANLMEFAYPCLKVVGQYFVALTDEYAQQFAITCIAYQCLVVNA